jgi:hypothetical protein
MTTVNRCAIIVWDGDLGRGAGRVTGASGAPDGASVTDESRIGRPDGPTSPEELTMSVTLSS